MRQNPLWFEFPIIANGTPSTTDDPLEDLYPCALIGLDGAITDGSTLTGYTRSAAANQTGSGLNTNDHKPRPPDTGPPNTGLPEPGPPEPGPPNTGLPNTGLPEPATSVSRILVTVTGIVAVAAARVSVAAESVITGVGISNTICPVLVSTNEIAPASVTDNDNPGASTNQE